MPEYYYKSNLLLHTELINDYILSMSKIIAPFNTKIYYIQYKIEIILLRLYICIGTILETTIGINHDWIGDSADT